MANPPAVFLVRDATLTDDVGYIKQTSEVSFYLFIFVALSMLQKQFLSFIITNQAGIAEGIDTEKEVSDLNKYIIKTLTEREIIIYDLFCSPHKFEHNCECKKPITKFIEKSFQLHNIDLNQSFIIDDHPSDVLCGINAWIAPLNLLTKHGKKQNS